jgi:hypothetical protein
MLWKSGHHDSEFVKGNKKGIQTAAYVPHTIVFAPKKRTEWFYSCSNGTIKQMPSHNVTASHAFKELTRSYQGPSLSHLLTDSKYMESTQGAEVGAIDEALSVIAKAEVSVPYRQSDIVAQFVYAAHHKLDWDKQSSVVYLTENKLKSFLSTVNHDFSKPQVYGILQQFILPPLDTVLPRQSNEPPTHVHAAVSEHVENAANAAHHNMMYRMVWTADTIFANDQNKYTVKDTNESSDHQNFNRDHNWSLLAF